MVKLISFDSTFLIPLPKVDLIVEEIDQYIVAYDKILQAIHSNSQFSVLVKNKQVFNWLRILQNRYGIDRVSIEELNLRNQLSNQIGMTVPDSVSDHQIIESGLMDLNIPANSSFSFDEYLISVFLGEFLIVDGGLRRIGEIIDRLDNDQWVSALKRPIINNLFKKRIQQLRNIFITEKRNGEIILLDWLEDSPGVLIRNLSALKILTTYPHDLGKRIFGQRFSDLLDLHLDLQKTPIIIEGNDKVIDEIRIYLNQFNESKDFDELNHLLNEMSGLLEIEFQKIRTILLNGNFNINKNLIELIRSKFHSLQSLPGISNHYSELDSMVSKPKPTQPGVDWDEDRWLEWAINSYLPYRFWLEDTGQIDDEVAETANLFSDWLFDNFGKLIYHSKRMAWKWLLDQSDEWKDSNLPILVIMIDNLNAKFYPFIHKYFLKQGFFQHKLNFCFSMLPSCTEVSKKCIITGHYHPFKETAYKKQVEETWNKRINKKVLYVSNIGEFRRIEQRDHDIYFLNYTPLDITLHQNDDFTGISHLAAIRNYIDSLSSDVHAFTQRIGAEQDLTVIIISDHGSTRIPKGLINVIQSNYYKEHTQDEHHRYIAIPDKEISRLPANHQFDCYLLKHEIMDLEINYLVARRLYRFLPTDEHVYIHGGLTPEETIIPCAVFKPITVSPKPPEVSNMGSDKIYHGTKFDLVLEITNLNNYSFEKCRIDLIDENLESRYIEIDMIEKLSRIQFEISTRCHRNAQSGSRKIPIRISYDFLGQTYSNEIFMNFEIIQPAKPKFDLDNL